MYPHVPRAPELVTRYLLFRYPTTRSVRKETPAFVAFTAHAPRGPALLLKMFAPGRMSMEYGTYVGMWPSNPYCADCRLIWASALAHSLWRNVLDPDVLNLGTSSANIEALMVWFYQEPLAPIAPLKPLPAPSFAVNCVDMFIF